MRAIVLTGGPHSGKTTLVEQLRARGREVVPEAALEVIEELNRTHGSPDAQRAWRLANPSQFQMLVAERQARAEEAARGRDVVLDRGIVDGLAYCRFFGVDPPPGLARLCDASRYDLAVICELVLPFDARHASGRFTNEESARKLEGLLEEVYRERGIPTVRLPVTPDRIDRLLAL